MNRNQILGILLISLEHRKQYIEKNVKSNAKQAILDEMDKVKDYLEVNLK
jgi:hypothetical protein